MSGPGRGLLVVEPIGTREAVGFWDGTDRDGKSVGGFGTVALDVYPFSPRGEELRLRRIDARVTLQALAERLELTPVELSGLEHGKFRFRHDGEWLLAFAAVQALADLASSPRGKRGVR